jgi:hypothetical protein
MRRNRACGPDRKERGVQVGAEAKLYAAGLGLMLFSPLALADIPDGADFMSDLGLEPRGRLYNALVARHRVVLLGTGSAGP